MSDEELAILWSLCPGLAPSTLRRLVRIFGGIRAFHEAQVGDWAASGGVEDAQVSRMDAWRRTLPCPDHLKRQLASRGIVVIGRGAKNYPDRLLQLADPPIALFVRGRAELLVAERQTFAIVGTRRMTGYGMEAARWIAGEMARREAVIVSGLALGVDATAHAAALEMGGDTVAVLGCGIDRCYPPSNRRLYDQIASSGALVSEYPPGTPVRKYHFPERNRLIASLSGAVVVVQAGDRSGALITAQYALELGRDVYAVPGPITSRASRGVNRLMFDGAIPLVDPSDLWPGEAGVREQHVGKVPAHLEPCYRALGRHQPIRAGELAIVAELDAGYVFGALLEMELARMVERLPDGTYHLRPASFASDG
ncbi:DNA-protecting protein DprA [Alicyclobacillus mali]|uniref:DNA-protecting protein DprA n=1 Tax=Alicyclobacillus mali (ex Roth et al. 2021) TaxID=1123961 RepID=A0ABS0F1V1_9BACL|nr:DNA-processing protein DprA [Alicyclobacillus mali (ex Roth et al. 2021)]MBF8377257.1 DNA-protecting protein DprA [Alicyclobacillus mali (ex Roth et al. 2021)]MCL6488093.1 DNA-processing protein DprA [Alicyclobacillus mali (ex Roth et al. 2021)]